MTDQCRDYKVDGEVVRVRGAEPMTDRDRDALAEVVRAAKAKLVGDYAAMCACCGAAARSRPGEAGPKYCDECLAGGHDRGDS